MGLATENGVSHGDDTWSNTANRVAERREMWRMSRSSILHTWNGECVLPFLPLAFEELPGVDGGGGL